MPRRDRLVRDLVRDRLIFTLSSGETFEGLLLDADDTTFVLGDAAQLSADNSRVPVDGQLYLPRLDVIYVQRPAPPVA